MCDVGFDELLHEIERSSIMENAQSSYAEHSERVLLEADKLLYNAFDVLSHMYKVYSAALEGPMVSDSVISLVDQIEEIALLSKKFVYDFNVHIDEAKKHLSSTKENKSVSLRKMAIFEAENEVLV